MYDKVLELLKEKNYSELKKLLSDMNEADIASIPTDVPEETLPLLYRILPKELAADVFVNMDLDAQEMHKSLQRYRA